MKKTSLITLALCAGLLSACTDDTPKTEQPLASAPSANAPTTQAPTVAPAPQAPQPVAPSAAAEAPIEVPKHLNAIDAARYKARVQAERAEAARVAALPKADPSVLINAYRLIEEPKWLSLLYLGMIGGEPDIKMLQRIYDPTFYEERDDFKLRDRINAFMPTAKAEMAEITQSRYHAMKITLNLGAYDFDKKAFALDALSRDGNAFSLRDAGAYVTFLNGQNYGWLPVADETEARRIEALRKDYTPHPDILGATAQDFTATVYFFVAGAKKGERLNELESQLTRVEIHDWKGNLIGTL